MVNFKKTKVIHDNEICVLKYGGIAIMGFSHLPPAIVAVVFSGSEASSISTDKTLIYGCPDCLNIDSERKSS